jgi:hypothetical protein
VHVARHCFQLPWVRGQQPVEHFTDIVFRVIENLFHGVPAFFLSHSLATP